MRPSSLTGFGEQRQVLFAELKFSLSMADTAHDGTGQGTHAGSIPLLRGYSFMNSSSDETGHVVSNRFRQVSAAGDADFLVNPQRRLPGRPGLAAA